MPSTVFVTPCGPGWTSKGCFPGVSRSARTRATIIVAVSGQDTTEVPPYIQDVMAAFYYVRSQPLQVGDTLVMPHFSEGKQYDLGVIVHERERIETPAGEFDCIKVEPLLRAEGMFRQEGRVFIWLTDDRLHMPVLVRSKLSVGSIRAELTGYRIGELWEE